MFPFRRILAPTDFSDTSMRALPMAAEMATHFGAELLLLHVVPMDTATPWDIPPYAEFGLAAVPVRDYEGEVRKEVEHRLTQLAIKEAAGVPARVLVGRGDAAGEIHRLAAQEKADLIVLATHGWTGWRHLVFG